MSVNVIVHDTRLEGRTPATSSSCLSFEVDEDVSIQHFFDRCRAIAVECDGINTLSIMAHGAEMMFDGRTGGGYGIVFCSEYITLDNVNLFALLADRVRHIDLYVCAIAAVSPDIHHVDVRHTGSSGVWHGDGNELCRQMAIHAQASVTAATEIQAYSPSDQTVTIFDIPLYSTGEIDFGEWEGTVLTYDSSGNIVDRQVYPSAWRTPDGVVHDPRLETRPAAP
jgi:hypothetical protein